VLQGEEGEESQPADIPPGGDSAEYPTSLFGLVRGIRGTLLTFRS